MNTNYVNLKKWGLTPSIESKYEPLLVGGLHPARVIGEDKGMYTLISDSSIMKARVSGKMIHLSSDFSDYPSVGDWVIVDRSTDEHGYGQISSILPRYSSISRKVSGSKTDTQVLASNVDVIFICMSLNNDFNLRRLERYIAISIDSGALPVVLLTKCDLSPDRDSMISSVERTALGIDVIAVSSLTNENIDKISKYVKKGSTVAFVGSSGVGKSTLANTLLGERIFDTDGLRNDDKGRHTTVTRNLIPFGDGNVLIDTPGLRSIELGDISESISHAFAEIDDIAESCRFSDCTHTKEPGCAVISAIESGALDESRLRSYKKLLLEAEFIKKKNQKKGR